MADVNVTITIPDQYVTRVLAAFNGLSNTAMTLDNEAARVDFMILEKQPDENNLQFGKRFIRQCMWQFVRLFEYKTDRDRYVGDVAAVSSPVESVPEDILT